ncbi:hypothetical protein [Cupriavidus sp. BIC8F]|uniref:hypothetical protein n=1 Tax=Cupriavidus sp. BIC8F TaxID=3079014 RepID=UPI002915CE2F|nr:hypothetical protein [Cupriavidus sp. BIC8F]
MAAFDGMGAVYESCTRIFKSQRFLDPLHGFKLRPPWKCDISHRFPGTDSKYWWRHRITDDRVWKARMFKVDRRCAYSGQRLCARMNQVGSLAGRARQPQG